MTTRKITQFKLTIYIAELYVYITNISIFNNDKVLVARPEDGKEQISPRVYQLPAGHYTIRIEINGQLKDNKIEIISNTSCNVGFDNQIERIGLNIPLLYSAALLGNHSSNSITYKSSHEYYTEPAKEISKINNLEFVNQQATNSGLFIFLRYPDVEQYKNKYQSNSNWEKFSILNKHGDTLCTFPKNCIKDDNLLQWNYLPNSGYIGFNAQLLPDLYFLKYDGEDARMIPIYVYKNWYTQFFMTFASKPLFGSIRIFLSKNMVFDPLNRNHYYVDICLDKLQNNDFTLDDHLLNNIAHGKFDSPMLGLLGAYIYLSSKETKKDELFKMIVSNLQNKILRNSSDSPDIWALNLLSYMHFKKTISTTEKKYMDKTPMLRIAFETIKNNALNYNWLIPEGSLNDHIVENQVCDSPYNTFKPFLFTTIQESEENEVALFRSQGMASAGEGSSGGKEIYFLEPNESLQNALDLNDQSTSMQKIIKRKISNVETPYNDQQIKALKNQLLNPKAIGWIGYSIANLIIQDRNITLNEIEERLNLPSNTIARKMKQLNLL